METAKLAGFKTCTKFMILRFLENSKKNPKFFTLYHNIKMQRLHKYA